MTILDRMVLAVEKVRARLLRASQALEADGVPYAVVGGNAVAAWVARVDVGAVRNTQDVDLLLEPEGFDAARSCLERAGFVFRHVAGVDLFLDGPDAKERDALHVIFAGAKIRPEYAFPAPGLDEVERLDEFFVLKLEALVRMKLTSFRRKDQVHLLDMLEVGLVDEHWLPLLPPELSERLKELLESPDD